MANIIKRFEERGILQGMAPAWMPDNIQYLTQMGSHAYGVNRADSDYDVYGFVIPPKEIIFPHTAGKIIGFGDMKHTNDRWNVWQYGNKSPVQVIDPDNGKEYDFNVYNIVDYFQLVMEGNPNMVDSLFTPSECVMHSTKVGDMVREHRHLFLTKKVWHTFKGYAFKQMRKMGSMMRTGKRKEVVEEHGFDLKFAYHVVRLLNEVEQLLTEGTMDLRRNREQLKAIRNGDWTKEQVESYFTRKEIELETVYNESELPWGVDDDRLKRIRRLLFECIEEHYGSLSKFGVVEPDAATVALGEIGKVLERYQKLLQEANEATKDRD